MGNRGSYQTDNADIHRLQAATGFTVRQLEKLYSRFKYLDQSKTGNITREDFLRIHELAINPLADRIVEVFFRSHTDVSVDFRQFVMVLAKFQPYQETENRKINSREQKLRFAFKMYDRDGDGEITRSDLMVILRKMVGENVSEEQLSGIAERAILETDRDGTQSITLREFCQVLARTDVEHKMTIRFF